MNSIPVGDVGLPRSAITRLRFSSADKPITATQRHEILPVRQAGVRDAPVQRGDMGGFNDTISFI